MGILWLSDWRVVAFTQTLLNLSRKHTRELQTLSYCLFTMVLTERLIKRAVAVKAVVDLDGDVAAASKRLRYKLSFVQKWYKQWQEQGNLNDLPRSGRPTVLKGQALDHAQELVLEEQSSTTAWKLLVEQGIIPANTHRSTVWRAVHKGDKPLEMGSERVIPLISAAARAKRKAFAEYHLQAKTDPSKIFAVDSTIIRLGKPGVSKKVWRRKGQKSRRAMPHKFPQVHVYAGICSLGKSRLRRCTCSTGLKSRYKKKGGKEAYSGVGSEEYVEILDEVLVPDAEDLFGAVGVKDWKLLQDGAPAHVARSTQQYLRSAGVQVLEKWPGSSPDLNPIEHLWAWLKQRVYKLKPKTLAELEKAVDEVWEQVPDDMCTRLMANMDRDWERVVQLDGAYIE
jgi:transposase